jgi:hypothetical protein
LIWENITFHDTLALQSEINMPKQYLYCITKAEDAQRLPLELRGVNEKPLKVITAKGLSCIVSSAPEAVKESDKNQLLAHTRVLEAILQVSPMIPLAFGHVTDSASEIEEKMLIPHADELLKLLVKVGDKYELSLKITWKDFQHVLKEIASTHPTIQQFRKKDRLSRNEQIQAGEIAYKATEAKKQSLKAEVVDFFSDLTVEHKPCKIFGEAMVANVAFLIQRDRLKQFDSRVNRYSKKVGESVILKYTGPVPPYNFISHRIAL